MASEVRSHALATTKARSLGTGGPAQVELTSEIGPPLLPQPTVSWAVARIWYVAAVVLVAGAAWASFVEIG